MKEVPDWGEVYYGQRPRLLDYELTQRKPEAPRVKNARQKGKESKSAKALWSTDKLKKFCLTLPSVEIKQENP